MYHSLYCTHPFPHPFPYSLPLLTSLTHFPLRVTATSLGPVTGRGTALTPTLNPTLLVGLHGSTAASASSAPRVTTTTHLAARRAPLARSHPQAAPRTAPAAPLESTLTRRSAGPALPGATPQRRPPQAAALALKASTKVHGGRHRARAVLLESSTAA